MKSCYYIDMIFLFSSNAIMRYCNNKLIISQARVYKKNAYPFILFFLNELGNPSIFSKLKKVTFFRLL